jgi:hypothetical protein
VPHGRQAGRPEVDVPPVNLGQIPPQEPGEWVNLRVRANDPDLNGDRFNVPPINYDQILPRGQGEWVRTRVKAQNLHLIGGERALSPYPARPENDENMEPEVPRMRSISLEPRARPFFEDGGGAAAPPPVYVPAARPLDNLPKIQMVEFKSNKGVPTQI